MITRISAELQRIESGNAIFKLEDGQELLIPKGEAEPLAAIGTAYTIQVLPETEAKLSQDELAKTLLNQIMRTHEDQE